MVLHCTECKGHCINGKMQSRSNMSLLFMWSNLTKNTSHQYLFRLMIIMMLGKQTRTCWRRKDGQHHGRRGTQGWRRGGSRGRDGARRGHRTGDPSPPFASSPSCCVVNESEEEAVIVLSFPLLRRLIKH